MDKNLLGLAGLIVGMGISFITGAHYYYYSPFYNQITMATAIIYPTKNNTAAGTVTFTQNKSSVVISVRMNGLTPGQHGFHIHEFGDCACDDAVCAGGHFNPTGQPHGSPHDKKRHVGDLGNITADENGNVVYDAIDQCIKLNGPHSIVGRTVIIHDQADDYITQPTGNAGNRVGCGVVGIKNENSKL